MDEYKPTHIAYSDEAYYLNNKYSSISMVSLELRYLEELDTTIKECLKSSGVREFKWHLTGSAKYKYCAIKIIDAVFEFVKEGKIRIDTIIWDSKKRKNFKRENEITILGKMYYHLYKYVLTNRWPKSNWKLHPDQQGSIDWEELLKILENVSSKLKIIKDSEGKLIFDEKRDFRVLEISEIDSKESCLCQITDLFSGLAAYYHLECPTCNLGPQQQGLTDSFKKLSNSDTERYEIIKHIKEKSKKSSMDIEFDSLKGVKTKNPEHPINFWQFEIKGGKHNNQKLSKFF